MDSRKSNRFESFPATNWSIVRRARSWTDDAEKACRELCQSYYYPVYGFLRRSGKQHHEAWDIVNEFFVGFISQKRPWKNALEGVTQERGISFRSCLLTALRTFVSDLARHNSAVKRGGSQNQLSLDEMKAQKKYSCEPVSTETPNDVFDRMWAESISQKALAAVRDRYSPDRFSVLGDYLTPGKNMLSYREAAEKLAMSEDGVKQAVKRLRAAYANQVRNLILQTVEEQDEVETELKNLINLLSR